MSPAVARIRSCTRSPEKRARKKSLGCSGTKAIRRELERRIAFVPEHPSDFFLARFSGDLVQLRIRATAGDILCHHKVRRSSCSDLRQMRDTNHLMVAAESLHFCADS